MYYEYWGLIKPPFDNVPDPTMYVESHASVESAIAETIFAIEEGNECISVIVGEVGSGKSLSLRLILDSLHEDRYRIAFITNPDMSFVQLLNEIIGQLTGEQCDMKRKMEQLEVFNKLLFKAYDEGKKVVIIIDEANAMPGSSLESLRLLTNMQSDNQNLFTLVLAGQMELAKKLEHPRRANLFQRIGAYCRIEKIESMEILKDYIETRLRLAGAKQAVFTESALPAIWQASEHGVPRLVNKVCKLCLKAGETNGLLMIDETVVSQIGNRFQRMVTSTPPKEAPRAAERSSECSIHRFPTPAPKTAPSPAVPEYVEETAHEENVAAASDALVRDIPAETPGESVQAGASPVHVKVTIPNDILQQAHSYTRETRAKLAGMLAAQTLQKYPQLAFSQSPDPVSLWSDIRASILNALEERAQAMA